MCVHGGQDTGTYGHGHGHTDLWDMKPKLDEEW